ncbi:MAG TPA: DUF6114 domain-containing protein [Streptosporangiaceae bacterium]|nr:DUF6114 domain-containing protein [Streptosporangiaceae bacterium]
MSDGTVSEGNSAGQAPEATMANRTTIVLASRARRGFRTWRRSRPFWAGLLLIVAGLELLTIPLPMHSMGLILHIGTGGVLGILIGAILIACALLLWFNPAQRIFYSIVAVLLAVAALIASNLGGFLIGTLLGVVGGSMGFAWTPERAGREAASDRESRGGNGMVLSGIPVIPVLGGLLALLNLGTGGSSPGGAGATPTPTPSASSCPSPGASPTPSPGISVSIGLGTNPSPCPSSSATPGPNPSPSPSPSPSGSGHPGHGPSPTPSPGAPKSPGHGAKSGPAKRAGTSPGVNIASSPSSLTAASAVITGFAYDGLATVHTARGPVKMMQFTMSSLSLSGVELTVSQGGAVLTTHAPQLDLSGKVVLYATKLSGDLLGVPVTITPQSPLATILQVTAPLTKSVPVPMTNVVTDQPYTSADSMSVNGLQIS